ncbi:YitT family protein [Intestinibacter bartlettii]|uniref:YitT family protein n=1 Tax=Intestinibacter bartlettii TaxID=261299 RepID=UPI0006C47875|nr:YitT family protein [Intestinibacter bartlettii]MDU6823478.1 YitT family protein [Intestinibacter bartlettii]MEE0616943.1 YitT family protein [Intestinibacter bartlettii]CUO75234.1 transporter protein [Intestinibacter bartlettii]
MKKNKDILIQYIGLIMACMIMAVGLNMFLVPKTIAPGGLSGLSVVISKLTGFPVSNILFTISTPLLLFSVKILGKKDAIKTFIGMAILTLSLKVTEPLSTISLTDNTLLAAISGSILVGLSLGILFRIDASTGGTDLIALMLNRIIPSIPVSKCLSMIDGTVVVLAGVVNMNFETGLYSAIALYIMVKIIDTITAGFDYAKAFFIITEKKDVLQEAIIELNRGITILDAKGGYTNEDKNVMLVVVNQKKQEVALKKMVKELDEKSFIIVTDVYEVLGKGFKSIDAV